MLSESVVKNSFCSTLAIFSLSTTLLALTPARADLAETVTKMAELNSVVASKTIRHCLSRPSVVRRLANTCTHALDLLAAPVAAAKSAMIEEEARVRKLACPSVVDYGCSKLQIRYRQAADLLAESADNLRLTEDEALSERHDGKWWDQAFVKDNRLSAIWARDFVAKASAAFEASSALTQTLRP